MAKRNFLLIAFFLTLLSSCRNMRAINDYFNETRVDFDNVIVSLGKGGNSGIIILENTIIIIDTKKENNAVDFFRSIENLLEDKRIIIVNTHLHHDHTSANYLFNAETIYIPNYSNSLWDSYVLPENRIDRLNYQKVTEEISIIDGNEVVRIIPTAGGHTSNDIIVYYENKNLLFTGDLLFYNYHPVMDINAGAHSITWSTTLNHIANNYRIDKVVPGHGSITDSSYLIEMNNYLAEINENIENEDGLNSIKLKYSYFDNLPGKTSFDKSVEYIRSQDR